MASEPGAYEPIEPGRVVGGKYRLVRQLAEGGMGEVWLARHEVLDADVAVKLMSAEIIGTEHALARFEREAKASAKLKSNHIVRVNDFGVEGEMPYMVMELLDGEDLGTRLKRDGPMTVADFVPMLRQIAKGLEVAHAAGFVHRDLKPSNIFIAREGRDEVVKIVDFGVARETKTKLVDEKTGSGVVLGSPHHMSPEQALGEKVDQRSDLWALAVVVFRALAGRKPFDSDVLATVAARDRVQARAPRSPRWRQGCRRIWIAISRARFIASRNGGFRAPARWSMPSRRSPRARTSRPS